MTGIKLNSCRLFFRKVKMRVPLKFGPETTTAVVCARAEVVVSGTGAKGASGWGETPLSIAWVWPSSLSYEYRLSRLMDFCLNLAKAWNSSTYTGHPMEIGRQFIEGELTSLWKQVNEGCGEAEKMPWLAALVCNSLFDLALHDAFGMFHGISTWETYTKDFMNYDLSWYYTDKYKDVFANTYPADYLIPTKKISRFLPVWHLVGAKDAVTQQELTGDEPCDGYPVLLTDWIEKDGLKCLKVKLTGTDSDWDYGRLVSVGNIALTSGVEWLSADLNCTVTDCAYVNDILDRLMWEHPKIFKMILYVEQPFPYEIEKYPLDVRSVSARKPLFMDESAHDWEFVAMGRNLGWSGVALKTCKTMTGALLSLCWAKKHGMTLMVQDLTNPMLAQIPHVELAAYAGTIMGVESNAMQFYPEASKAEARIHPGLYTRKDGVLDLSSLGKEGFGYRMADIEAARTEADLLDAWEEA